ncbi:MAG TPA: hypothetical protein ENJ41_03680, partial [Oceanospirillales bacterium]|nr:hypothetical protein [Oceanospirillales bacterium]
MNRRKFLNIGSMMAALGLTGVSFAKNLDFNIKEIKLMDEMEKLKVVDAYFKKAELIEYPKGKKFYARVRNINTNYLKDDAEVRFE